MRKGYLMKSHVALAILGAVFTLAPTLAAAETRMVSTMEELRAAVDSANPGDRIILADGAYRLESRLNIRRPGTATEPIIMEAANRHGAIIESDTLEGFYMDAPHWHLEGLHFKGVCANDSDCEHALHIVGSSDFAVIRHNIFEDFNAQIKANGFLENNVLNAPDDVLVEYNEFFDNDPRAGSNPVTKLNINSGSRWIVRGNFIHDFAKGGGNNISYAAFYKGKSRDGIFERNLVVCSLNHEGNVRIGLSIGGGGTGDQFCVDNTCTPEHTGGIIRNNIIANCSDVGIYVNEGVDTLIEHNTIYNTSGIDIRFEVSTASIRNNIFSGRARERNGGTILVDEGNLAQLNDAAFASMFVDPDALDFTLRDGSMLVDQGVSTATPDDFCGAMRDANKDIGAIEYLLDAPCDTSMLPPQVNVMMPGGDDMGMMPPEDMGTTPMDMGNTPVDMGTTPIADMAGGGTPQQDMGSTGAPDQGSTETDMASTPADMSTGGGKENTAEDEGCMQAAGHRPAHTPLSLLGVLGIVGLAWRRRRR